MNPPLQPSNPPSRATTRREFLSQTGKFAAASALAGVAIPHVHGAGDDSIQLALIGAPYASDLEGLPGSTIAGTALSAIIFPRSVAGSQAPQTAAFAAPSVSFVWDRRPPRVPGS